MKNKFNFTVYLVIFLIASCSSKQTSNTIDPILLPGKYSNNISSRDSIFIYQDGSYDYVFYRMDKGIDRVTGTWKFKQEINSIFFKDFKFYSDLGPSDISGTWAPKVTVNEAGELMIIYSERSYYVKVVKK